MDWWKGKPSNAADLQSKPSKNNESKKNSKPKNKAEPVSSNGQSTILDFVGNKDERSQAPESSPNRQDGVEEFSCKSHQQDTKGEVSASVSNLQPDSPTPTTCLMDTPLISRVSIIDSPLPEPHDMIENTKSTEVSSGGGSEDSPQAEPTRRSARLKSIQVKQALKDESIYDETDDDFQPKKPKTVSKGKLFFLSKEEKERLREEEEARMKLEEAERQRERERQQCERLREEIKRAKEENLQRSLGRQTNPFLLPRAVPSSFSIVIDADEEAAKGSSFLWQDDQEGTLFPFPLITHVTQLCPPVMQSCGKGGEATSLRHDAYELVLASSGCHNFVQKQIHFHLDFDASRLRTAHEEQRFLTSFKLLRKEIGQVTTCDRIAQVSNHCDISKSALPNCGELFSKECISAVHRDKSSIIEKMDKTDWDTQSLHPSTISVADRCGYDTHDAVAIFDRLRHRRQAEDCRKLWADAYRPKHGSEVCGNQDNVKLLRKWLVESDNDSSNKRHKHTSKKRKDSDDDDDDFEDTGCQAILISGPPGCGKSAAIYALAEELKLQVLEINSSDKRCGRLVLDKVGEATRSQSLLKRATGEEVCPVSSARNETTNSGKRKKGSSKYDHETSKILGNKEPAVEIGAATALILFEEVDVLLDHDKGFLAAVIALIEQTCVPIVMTCQQKPSMMEGLGLRELVWKSPDWRDAVLNLSIIATLEGWEPVFEDIHRTYSILNFDFRRTLMLLQLASVKPFPTSISSIESDISIREHLDECSKPSSMLSIMPSPVAIAHGFYNHGATDERVRHFIDAQGVCWKLSQQDNMTERYRILEGDLNSLELVFNNEWDDSCSTESNCIVKSNDYLQHTEEMWQMADAMSCALCLSDADVSRKGSGGSLAGNIACLVAGCLQMCENAKKSDWRNLGDSRQNWMDQKDMTSEIVHPKACGLGRSASVMLEYAPWVRDICQVEETKKLLGACRRRRAAHHFTYLPHTVVECFSSSHFVGCPPGS